MSAEQAGEPQINLDETAAQKVYGERATAFYKAVGVAGREFGIGAWIVCSLEVADDKAAEMGIAFRTISSGTDDQMREIAKAMALAVSGQLTEILESYAKRNRKRR